MSEETLAGGPAEQQSQVGSTAPVGAISEGLPEGTGTAPVVGEDPPQSSSEAPQESTESKESKESTESTESAESTEAAPEYKPGEPIPLEVNLGQLTGGEEELSNVNIVVPEEHAALLTEAGLNPVQVVQELWSGEFGLSDETKQVLYDKYGKVPIDIALDGIRSAAAMEYFQVQKADAERQAADDALWNSALELLGGAEAGEATWDAMDAYARKNFSPEEIEQFNSAMESGSAYLQRLAITDLKSRVDSGKLNLIDGDGGSGAESSSGYLTQKEFLELFKTGEYHKDPERYDAMRKLGLSKGV